MSRSSFPKVLAVNFPKLLPEGAGSEFPEATNSVPKQGGISGLKHIPDFVVDQTA